MNHQCKAKLLDRHIREYTDKDKVCYVHFIPNLEMYELLEPKNYSNDVYYYAESYVINSEKRFDNNSNNLITTFKKQIFMFSIKQNKNSTKCIPLPERGFGVGGLPRGAARGTACTS